MLADSNENHKTLHVQQITKLAELPSRDLSSSRDGERERLPFASIQLGSKE